MKYVAFNFLSYMDQIDKNKISLLEINKFKRLSSRITFLEYLSYFFLSCRYLITTYIKMIKRWEEVTQPKINNVVIVSRHTFIRTQVRI